MEPRAEELGVAKLPLAEHYSSPSDVILPKALLVQGDAPSLSASLPWALLPVSVFQLGWVAGRGPELRSVPGVLLVQFPCAPLTQRTGAELPLPPFATPRAGGG